MGQKVYLIQAKKISFVEKGRNAEYSIWGARNRDAKHEIFVYLILKFLVVP